MKKHVLMMLMAMLSVAPGIGQTHYEAQMSLGVHGGVNLSQVMFSPSIRQKFLPGANAGINFRYTEEKHFGFIIEANFEQRGWAENFDDAPFSYSRTINYVQIPFMSHIYFGRRHKFFINLGPSVSFKTGDSVKSNFDYSNVGSVPDFPVHTSQQYGYPTKGAVDFGISGGLGGELGITRRHSIYLEARYYFGIANVLPAGRTDHFKSSNPMALSISLGYWFRMK
jgi:hypothetical protein